MEKHCRKHTDKITPKVGSVQDSDQKHNLDLTTKKRQIKWGISFIKSEGIVVFKDVNVMENKGYKKCRCLQEAKEDRVTPNPQRNAAKCQSPPTIEKSAAG